MVFLFLFLFVLAFISDLLFFPSRDFLVGFIFSVFGTFVTYYLSKRNTKSILRYCDLRFLIQPGVKF